MAANEPGVTFMRLPTATAVWRCHADQFTYLLHEDVPVLAARDCWSVDQYVRDGLFRSFITLRVELVLPVHVRLDSRGDGPRSRGSLIERIRGVPRTNHDDNWRIVI